MALGLLMILSALTLILSNLRQEHIAMEAAADAEQEVSFIIEQRQTRPTEIRSSNPLLVPPKVLPVEEIDGYPYIGTLSIPVLELDLPIMDDWSYPRLRRAPCRQSGDTALDLVVAGHNYQSHFGRLSTLNPGDLLLFTDMDGDVTTYEVETVETIRPTDTELVFSDRWNLALYTCTYGGRSRIMVGCVSQKPV